LDTPIATSTAAVPIYRENAVQANPLDWLRLRARALRQWARELRWATELVQDPFGPRPE